ncbi:hypothetical protein DPEC_G00104650 [Dallia pectoralis]|uniref:Uncharacterized protein n=1 Tax=Dallia pectoralis TaxID=75939 RepID=A0ACC2GY52_DALPE|nr:hypothetical protein DPEC_G00104650 [Dallia pectoralis]
MKLTVAPRSSGTGVSRRRPKRSIGASVLTSGRQEGTPKASQEGFWGGAKEVFGRTAERAPTVLVLQERPPLLRGCRQGEGNPWSYSHYPRRGKTLFCRRRQGQKTPGGVG